MANLGWITSLAGPRTSLSTSAREIRTVWIFAGVVVVGLLLLEVLGGVAYALAATALAAAAFVAVRQRGPGGATQRHTRVDRWDLIAMAATYAIVVASFRIAFTVIQGSDMVLFAFFAAGLVAGVAIPVVYTVWGRQRTLATLGLSSRDLRRTALLAVVFAGVQFSITLLGYQLPTPREWVPLLVMALMVGVFESIFFRGFVQGRLEAAFGTSVAVFGAAILYGVYHVGYGMTLDETVFLIGLGIVYALAFATTRNLLVLWPLLTPLGSLFAQLEGGQLAGRLPWASLLGFADVIGVFAFVLWRAHRHERRPPQLTPTRRAGEGGEDDDRAGRAPMVA